MNKHLFIAVLTGVLLCLRPASAATFYVAQSNPSPVPPYASWNTAATNIQDAINAASNGDLVLVTNGVYAAGGLAMASQLTNRVALNIPLTVQSVNGPWVTVIQGAGATNGPSAVRCAWLTNGASLLGFTLQGGATASTGDPIALESGGGVWCASTNAVVANCVIRTNAAYYCGGGAYQGTLRNCFLTGNASHLSEGGGAAYSTMTSCTVTTNTGGGVYNAVGTNCIVCLNGFPDIFGGTFVYCCTPSTSGLGNISANPQLFGDGVHLVTGSPCIGAGLRINTGTDIFGVPWSNPPSIGCAEYNAGTLVTPPVITLTSNPEGFSVGKAAVAGQGPLAFFWLQNGVPLQDNGHFTGTQTSNLMVTGVRFTDAGNYQLVVSNSLSVVTSSVAPLTIHCVAAANLNPLAPYIGWANAATNIQDAITAAAPGDVVLVTNGVYASGGISMDGVLTNRVSLNKNVLVQSVNGPGATVIQGAVDPVSTNGLAAIRCAWLTNSAILAGFTLHGGATRASSAPTGVGGGVYGSSTNAVVCNCFISTNFAYLYGGGAYKATLIQCTLAGNESANSGGGAEACNLFNCLVASNITLDGSGGGSDGSHAMNCAYVFNSSIFSGGAANGGSLINCTVSGNISSGYSSGYGAAVYGATLTNCIVSGNLSRTSYPNSNYASCTLTYCDADPLPSGTGNLDVNPQLLADGIHIAATSPCIGLGTSNMVSGTDIDGQPWKTPPSMGCDEWYSAPIIAVQPTLEVNTPSHGLTISAAAAGQSPFSYFWSLNGAPLQDNGHYVNSGTASLTVNNFGLADAGSYQVVVTNTSGSATSQVAQVVIHAVNGAGLNPVPPYSTWATAATNIQDAINVAAAGDIVLVTNGVYAYGGAALAGGLTNRVALTVPIVVTSVGGYANTIIQGMWDPVSTNGPAAVRCAYVADGATLMGFTLENGATRATGDGYQGGPLESGGGVLCNSTNGIVANCVLSNNCAVYGGGIAYGTANNSLVLNNQAFDDGGGSYYATLNNCTVVNNSVDIYAYSGGTYGAGTYYGIVKNSIVVDNFDGPPGGIDDFYQPVGQVQYFNSCTGGSSGTALSGNGNIELNPSFLDFYHLATNSPCMGAGSSAYASGTDLDGQPWANPPSMGCSEVVVSNLVGPLTVSLLSDQTNVLVNRYAVFTGAFAGHAALESWAFGDSQTENTSGENGSHIYTVPGIYTVTYTVYNNDNPAGVSATTNITVLPLNMPQLQSSVLLTNGFTFQFSGQASAQYTIQYTTNLTPPVVWSTFGNIYYSSSGTQQVTDSTMPTGTRFYRVLAQ